MRNGTFYVIEGIDGSGKTTIAHLLAPWLDAVIPDVEMDGEPRRDLLYDVAYYRRYNKRWSERIRGLLETRNVLQVRYIHSNLANEYLVEGELKEEPEDITRPDRIIYLTVDEDELERRLSSREKRSRRESKANIKRLLHAYDTLFAQDDRVLRVDTTAKDERDVVEDILAKLHAEGHTPTT